MLKKWNLNKCASFARKLFEVSIYVLLQVVERVVDNVGLICMYVMKLVVFFRFCSLNLTTEFTNLVEIIIDMLI